MAMSEANKPNPARICYLLHRLPVELRLKIYKYSFEGSRVQAILAKDAEYPFDQQTAGLVLQSSKHYNLLLACRTIYDEALDTYWSETVLRLKCPDIGPCSFRTFDRSKLKLDTYSHRLCASLPEAAKANVKHVRGMVLPAVKSTWVKQNPLWTAPALLATFKKLVSCDITPSLAHPVDGLLVHFEELEDKNYSRFRMMRGDEPSEFLSERYGVTDVGEIAFFFKGASKHAVSTDGNNVQIVRSNKRPLFRNFSTGIAFEDVTWEMDNEEAFNKVMQVDT